MAATEELRILLRTVADTSGLTQTEQAVKGVTASSQSLTAELQKFAVGYFTVTKGVELATNALGSVIQATRDHERITRATTASYGAQTAQWTRFGQQLSATTGFTSDAILEAALSARTLSSNYGLTIEQTQKLISVSADLARIRGIGVAEAFERVQSAIRGEAEASEYLGLTLNATYLKTHAMNGALKDTYETMTDTQKAQVIYNELLKQTADFTGLAAGSADSLDGAMVRAESSTNKLQLALGKLVAPSITQGLQFASGGMEVLAKNAESLLHSLTPIDLILRGLSQVQADLKWLTGSGTIPPAGIPDPAFRAMLTRTPSNTGGTVPGFVDPAFAGGSFNLSPGQFAPSDARAAARIALLDQARAAVRDITSAQDAQVDLQRQSVDLAAQEASIRLSMLPAQQQMAELQRTVTEQQIRARQAALPATEALDDLHYEQERARLIAGNRNATAEERSSARRLLRESARAEPGLALAALEAGRGVTLAGRAVERVGLGEQLFQLTQERALAQITLAQQTNSLLASIAEQRTQAILLTVNVTGEGFSQEVYKELIEAADQATQPTIVQLSGVRR